MLAAVAKPDHKAIRRRLEAAKTGLEAAESERDEAMAEAWDAGWNLRMISQLIGVSYVTVSAKLDAMGVRHRPTYRELGRRGYSGLPSDEE